MIALRHPHQSAGLVNVLPSGEFRIKAQPELENGAHPSGHRDLAGGRPDRSGDQLQKRAFAGAVLADHPERIPGGKFERHVMDGPVLALARDLDAKPAGEPLEV